MIAVFVNAVSVLIGSILGSWLGKNTKDSWKLVVMVSAGCVTLLIGLQMAWKGQRILYLLVALLVGGVVGTWLKIEDRIAAFGEKLKALLPNRGNDGGKFAQGFLNASVLFCVGAMTILGSFQAGTEGKYDLILIKSVLDGVLAFVLSGVFGIGVAFSALSVLVYQGLLTAMSGWAKPWVDANPLLMSEISGVGGLMVVMIAINLFEIKKIPTGNFLPALVAIVVLVLCDPWLQNALPHV